MICMQSLAKYVILTALFLYVARAQATVTMLFTEIGVANATGFADSSGTPQNGMNWGIIVSTSDSMLSAGLYDVFDYNTSGFLSINGILTDDYYVAQPVLTSTSSTIDTEPGGDGSIYSITAVPYGGATNITQSDPFALIWFPTAPAVGSSYGVFTDSSFMIPSDGSNTSYSSVFLGPDPAKPASYTFAVPEPNRVVLLLLGGLPFLMRRRK